MWAIKFVPEAKKTSFPHDCIVWVCLFGWCVCLFVGWFVCLALLLVSTEIPWHRLLIMSDNYIRACHDLGEGCWRILHCQGPIPGRDGFAGVRSCVLCFESECFVSEQGKVIPGSPGVERSRGSCTSQHWAQQGDVMKLQPQLVDIRMSMQAFCSLQSTMVLILSFRICIWAEQEKKEKKRLRCISDLLLSPLSPLLRCRRCQSKTQKLLFEKFNLWTWSAHRLHFEKCSLQIAVQKKTAQALIVCGSDFCLFAQRISSRLLSFLHIDQQLSILELCQKKGQVRAAARRRERSRFWSDLGSTRRLTYRTMKKAWIIVFEVQLLLLGVFRFPLENQKTRMHTTRDTLRNAGE